MTPASPAGDRERHRALTPHHGTRSGVADEGRLNLYDASISLYGSARVFAILGHFYKTGEIISQAPRSEVEVSLVPPEAGSFRQTLLVAVVAGIVAAPFGVFSELLFKRWFPQPDPQMQEVIDLLKEQNAL